MKLQQKVILSILPIIVLGIISMGYAAYLIMQNFIENKLVDELDARLNNVASIIDEKINVAEANIQLFTKNNYVKRYVLADEEERYELLQGPLQRLFITYQDAYEDYYEIRIINKDGFEDTRVVNRDFENITEEEASSEIFRLISQSEDNIYSGFHINPDNNEWVIYVANKIITRNDAVDNINKLPELRGYMVLTISLDFLKEIISSQKVLDNGFLFLNGYNNKPVITPFEQTDILQKHNIDIQVLSNSLKPGFAGSSPNGDILKTREVANDMGIYGFMPIADIEKQYGLFGKVTTFVTLTTLLVALLLVYIALRKFVLYPVSKLDAAARDVAVGNLDIQIDLKREDELGKLAESFQFMADNLRESTDQAKFLAYHDSLTGLPNRLMFQEYLDDVITNAARYKIKFALIFLDVDDFKKVNDSFGHQVGDELLRLFSSRIRGCLRTGDFVARSDKDTPGDLLARLGGDEFILFLPYIDNPFEVSVIAQRIIELFAEPINIEGHDLHVNASLGITIYPDDASTSSELMRNADIAMYHAKERGKNNYQYFSDSLNVSIARRLKIENKLRAAIKNDDLEVYYQPKVDIKSMRIVGVEALSRWFDEEEGYIPPSEFISIAEETGLILDVGKWIINKACEQIKLWSDKGVDDIHISVNVSSIQVGRSNLNRILVDAIQKYQIDPSRIDIELTESTLMKASKNTVKTLKNIKKLGVQISLDDFGTGYSSLSYLREFSIDTLKIDRSFVMEIKEGKKEAKLISAIIAMAHSLNLQVVAEGVEEEFQHEFLKEQGCDMVQGFYFSKALPRNDIEEILLGRKSSKVNIR